MTAIDKFADPELDHQCDFCPADWTVAHWNTPFGAQQVAATCDSHVDLIEEARDAEQRITRSRVLRLLGDLDLNRALDLFTEEAPGTWVGPNDIVITVDDAPAVQVWHVYRAQDDEGRGYLTGEGGVPSLREAFQIGMSATV